MADSALDAPPNFINRELSALAFNERVLAQALDEEVPLLERWRFLCICTSNLDEFFEIRIAGLKQLQEAGTQSNNPDGLTVAEQLAAVHERAAALMKEQYRCLNAVLLPQLTAHGIVLVNDIAAIDADALRWLEQHFDAEVEPVLSPLALDPSRPFPRIQNKSLNFVVQLSGKDAFHRDSALAVVQAPRSLPRIVELPVAASGQRRFVALSTLVEAFVARLFKGVQVLGCYQFRLTRNSDLYIDDEEVDDLRRALEGELAQRRYGAAVRLETAADCPPSISEYLLQQFGLTQQDWYQVPGPVNLNRFAVIYQLAWRADLCYPPLKPPAATQRHGGSNLFARLRRRDLLLHHPYESFDPVLNMLRDAATDPKVLAVKQTLYRTGDQSPVVDSLCEAARRGKDVTVVIELRARFDEQANLELAARLQEAGAHVVYGVVGFKTHAKLILIVRREASGLRRYCHLGTGNYHPGTARAYTDYGLLTADAEIGADVHDIFMQLTGLSKAPRLRRLLMAPFDLRHSIEQRIDQECSHAAAGRPARIIAKLNALVDPLIIARLYQAARAGVTVDLLVRGLCALRPGIGGLSERITVRSLVGRFLEHSRVFWFQNGGQEQLYLGSADWMERNFMRRVEVAFPIQDERLKARICRDLDLYLSDNRNAWELQSDGSYLKSRGEPQTDAQAELLVRYAATSRSSLARRPE